MEINLKDIPTDPGVYLFKGDGERILYVGKAKSLRARVSNYFNAGVKSKKIEKMLSQAKSLRTIVVSSEAEAFLLEMNLIKTEQPKYNVLLKDAKSYPYVKLTGEEYPRLIYTRNLSDREAEYYGPFVNAGELKVLLEYLKHAFPLRTCSDTELKKGRICLNYQIHRCAGPCENLVSKEDYQKIAAEVRSFIRGDTGALQLELKTRMEEYSENMRYEEAAFFRDRLAALKDLFARQQIINSVDERSLDIFYRFEIDSVVGVTQLFVRGGRLLGAKSHFFTDEEELLEPFILQYYANIRHFPDMILAAGEEVSDGLAEALSKAAGRKILLRKRGFSELLEIGELNALQGVKEYLLKLAAGADIPGRLSKLCGAEISRVECIDISHLAGEHTVGVSVVSEEGGFVKNEYRKYKIKSAENDDVRSVSEVVSRKMRNVKEGSEREADLYLIDGGVSQLNAAVSALREVGSSAVCLSISKSRHLKFKKHEGEESIEEIHAYGRKNPLKFKRNDPLMLFFQKQRDEAHRFAIKYSRSLALKKTRISPLLEVEGVGDLRARKILLSVPDLYVRADLTTELLSSLAHIPLTTAQAVCEMVNKLKREGVS